jgi:hypothetical protein
MGRANDQAHLAQAGLAYRARMADDLEKARQEMDSEFAQFRGHLGNILEAVNRVSEAGPTDDVHGLLEHLEDVVHKTRTGGILGSGAKGHREAREEWLKLGGGPAKS